MPVPQSTGRMGTGCPYCIHSLPSTKPTNKPRQKSWHNRLLGSGANVDVQNFIYAAETTPKARYTLPVFTAREHGKCVLTLTPRRCIALSSARVTVGISRTHYNTRMWANAQRDGRPAEHRWRPLFIAAVWLTPTTRCRAVTLPRRETRWNLQGCLKLPDRSQPLVGRRSPYCEDIWRTYRCLAACSRFQTCILNSH